MSDNDLHVLEIAVEEFDLNLIPAEARIPGTEPFNVAVKNFYEDQLGKIAAEYSVSIENGKIRVTWRKSSIRPDALDVAVNAMQSGDYATGVHVLELLAPSRQGDATLHYNLGMAYSDLGKLEKSIDHLKRSLEIDKSLVNAKVALGVAYARQKDREQAAVILREAVLDDPDNGYALRNFGAVLMQLGRDKSDALRYLQRAVELLPEDQQAWLGLAQAQMDTGDPSGADQSLLTLINIQPYSSIAETAKQMRSRIAEENFRKIPGGGLRMDAVQYCRSALRTFAKMTPDQVRTVGLEIATIGMNGIDVNNSQSEYRLRSLPGAFSGLHLLCYEYIAFKQIAPDLDIGFDVSSEYEEAKRLEVSE